VTVFKYMQLDYSPFCALSLLVTVLLVDLVFVLVISSLLTSLSLLSLSHKLTTPFSATSRICSKLMSGVFSSTYDCFSLYASDFRSSRVVMAKLFNSLSCTTTKLQLSQYRSPSAFDLIKSTTL